MEFELIWNGLLWPLLRLLFFVSLGLMIANLIEALNWTHVMARFATPLTRLSHLQDVSGASFSMAFFSGVSANSMLAEYYEKGKLSKKQLILSNLFNSLPTYFLHLPTVFFITLPFLGSAAAVYVSLTLGAALLRTGCTVILGRILLPAPQEQCVACVLNEKTTRSWREALRTSWKRFKSRIKKIVVFTVPIYILIFVLNRVGMFKMLSKFLADHVGFLSFLSPEALGIVVFHVAAEFTAGLAAAGALLQKGDLGAREVILALLVGNILSSPIRAFRHQFPYYAGIFRPQIAFRLIAYNQTLRALSVLFITVLYYYASMAF